MPIIQPKIHTKITIHYASGMVKSFVVLGERQLLDLDGLIDVLGIQHVVNRDRSEHIELEHINWE
jgi:hypothetical protein